MTLTRRRALQATGTATLAALGGCLTDTRSDSQESAREYSLSINRIDGSPVEHALYEPDDSGVFGEPAQTALENVLPDGRHTTYGYEPLPSDAYVEREGSYYQTKSVVTGRQQMDRQLVRVDPVPKAEVPDTAELVDTFEQPTARVLKILHSHDQSGGQSSAADLLRGDSYVLRRPSERESRLGTGELDGHVVTLTESRAWAYRIRVTTEQLTETAHTAVAIEVADSKRQFREVVFGSRIDAELAPADVPEAAREILQQAIAGDAYKQQAPITDAFDTVLAVLGLGTVDSAVNGKLLWYDDQLYRYGLYINSP